VTGSETPNRIIERFATSLGLSLPENASHRLERFGDLLVARAIALGLVAASDRARILERHVLDSLRAAPAFGPQDRAAYDLGSGAGLPGIVLACALPDRGFRLVEPKRRAVAFLELATERLELTNVEIVARRHDELTGPADVVTARAFGPVDRSWAAAWALLRPGGRLVYFAGRDLARPEEAARGLRDPEPPGEVHAEGLVESYGPLVIMARRR
jgi:16S rRNA (guanine527-N7)-methyltransferase